MVLLKLTKDYGNCKKKEIIPMGSIMEAVDSGQKSGLYYEVVDLLSGRVIDWNEVNIRPEEDWYYDDSEMIWKKRPTESAVEVPGTSLLDWFLGGREETNACGLCY